MKRILFCSLFFLVITNILAQTKNIEGIVFDDVTKEIIESAGIRILSVKDSSFVTGTATNDKGEFNIKVKQADYIVQVSFIGYISQYFRINSKDSGNIGRVYLKENVVMLNEAMITAKAIEIQVKGDTIEYNADSYKVQQSAVVEDLLKKMPGAEVDSEGKITINGKEIKKILVDGKEFFGSDPKAASKNIPAALVEKLQVLDRKSDMAQMTGFDDGDEETIINLTVKKGMKQGLYGSATVGIGTEGRYGASAIANYMHQENQFTILGGSNNTNNTGFTDNISNTFRGMRGGRMMFGGQNGITKTINTGINLALNPSKKFKWGGNIRYANTDNDVKSESYTKNYNSRNPKGDIYENRNNMGSNESSNFNSDLRFEWSPDSITKIIFSPNIQFGKNTNIQHSNYISTYLNPQDSANWGKSDMYAKGDSKNLSGRLEMSRQLGKQGRILSFGLSGGYNDLKTDGLNSSNTTYRKQNGDSLAVIDQKYTQNNNSNNWKAYISYVEPLGKNNFIQLSYSYRKNYSESDKNTLMKDGLKNYTIVDTTATKKLENNFENQEIELNFKSIRDKYDYTLGIALQPSYSESWTITPQKKSHLSNNVLNYAPVAQLNYIWDKRRNLRINYNGSTNQPTTTQLSDVTDESDPTNVIVGNPNLKPSFNNNFRIRYQDSNPQKGSFIMAFGGFDFTKNDIVTKTIRKPEDGTRKTTYTNVDGNWGARLRIVLNRPLKNKKFSVSSMSFVNYQQTNGFVNEDKNKVTITNLVQAAGLQFRSDLFDFGTRAFLNYSNTINSLENQDKKTIYNYGGMANATLRLPQDFSLDSDLTYSANSGTSDRFRMNSWVWNAGIYKQMLKGKNATLKVNVYDILQQRTNVTQTSNSYSFSETLTNTLQSYVMVSFSYRFQIFKGGAKRPESSEPMFMGTRPPHG